MVAMGETRSAGRTSIFRRIIRQVKGVLPFRNKLPNPYDDLARSAEHVRLGHHRVVVGGLWDEVGRSQFEYVVGRGTSPQAYVLDLGCGCLRGGVHFVTYLLPGRYYGVDISRELLDAGYDLELGPLGLQHKLPRTNLVCDGEFNLGQLGVTFDVAVAISLFTHLTPDRVRLSLTRLADVVRVGGAVYATICLAPADHDPLQPRAHSPGGVVSFSNKDPYHYREQDIRDCAAGLPWRVTVDTDWYHPRAQTMLIFERLPETA